MTQPTSSSPAPPPSSPEDPFRYGWRYVKLVLPDGRVELDQVPLTLENTLHPEEEDEIPVCPLHKKECGYLANVLRAIPLAEAGWFVTADLRIDWGVAGIRPHSPDIAVFVGLRDPIELHAGTFHLSDSGGRCVLVIEVVSLDRRDNDVVHKFNHYHRVGIPLYLIVDQEQERGPQTLRPYRWRPEGYEAIPLDAQGRWYMEAWNFYLFLRGEQLIFQDAETGKELGNYSTVSRQLEQADRKLQENETVMEQLVEQRHAEIRAREAAEQQIREQAQAREAAEQQIREQTEAREAAERQARDQAQAREAAETRIRELEERLRQMLGGQPTT